MFVGFDSLCPINNFSVIYMTGQVFLGINVSCSRTQLSDACEAQTHGPWSRVRELCRLQHYMYFIFVHYELFLCFFVVRSLQKKYLSGIPSQSSSSLDPDHWLILAGTYITVTGNSSEILLFFSKSFIGHLTQLKEGKSILNLQHGFAIHSVNLLLFTNILNPYNAFFRS